MYTHTHTIHNLKEKPANLAKHIKLSEYLQLYCLLLHSTYIYRDTDIIDMLQRTWLKVASKENVAAGQYSTPMDSPKLPAN